MRLLVFDVMSVGKVGECSINNRNVVVALYKLVPFFVWYGSSGRNAAGNNRSHSE